MFRQTISTGNNITYLKNTGNMTHLQPENQVKVKTIKARLIKLFVSDLLLLTFTLMVQLKK